MSGWRHCGRGRYGRFDGTAVEVQRRLIVRCASGNLRCGGSCASRGLACFRIRASRIATGLRFVRKLCTTLPRPARRHVLGALTLRCCCCFGGGCCRRVSACRRALSRRIPRHHRPRVYRQTSLVLLSSRLGRADVDRLRSRHGRCGRGPRCSPRRLRRGLTIHTYRLMISFVRDCFRQ